MPPLSQIYRQKGVEVRDEWERGEGWGCPFHHPISSPTITTPRSFSNLVAYGRERDMGGKGPRLLWAEAPFAQKGEMT